MTIDKAAKSGIWLATLTFISTVISYAFTIYVARLLTPDDYGLMSIASFFTAYVEVFAAFGLGAAIIQREFVSNKELSSIFWFSLTVGIVLFCATFFIAKITATVFDDSRVIPIVYSISVLFIIGSLKTVPQSLIHKSYGFKAIGKIKLISTLVASVAQVILAKNNFGVYTLIFGMIILRLTETILTIKEANWRPEFHARFSDLKPFLGFGIHLATSSTLRRILETLDRIIIGKIFGTHSLGLYGYGMTLSQMPIDKIWPIFQQVLFPLLSNPDTSHKAFEDIYFEMLKLYLLLVTPILLGGSFYSYDIIVALLGEKWLGVVPFFQAFCIMRLFDSLMHFTNLLHVCKGMPERVTRIVAVQTVSMIFGILVASQFGLQMIIYAWLLIIPTITIAWIIISMKSLDLPLSNYLGVVLNSMKYSIVMLVTIEAISYLIESNTHDAIPPTMSLIISISIGVLSYGSLLLFFEKKFILKGKEFITRGSK